MDGSRASGVVDDIVSNLTLRARYPMHLGVVESSQRLELEADSGGLGRRQGPATMDR
jgi:hypothetical protein